MVEYIEEKGKNCPNKEVATNVMEAIKLLEHLVQLVEDPNNRMLSIDKINIHLFVYHYRKAHVEFVDPFADFFTSQHRQVKFFISWTEISSYTCFGTIEVDGA